MRSVSLEKVQAAVTQYIPREKLPGGVLEAEWRYDLEAMVVRLRKYVWSERLADETVRWPATWWDAFKDRWFPRWALRRWPVRWKHADFTIYRGYPDLVMPERQSVPYIVRRYK